jgi:16S rRNA (guanine966-N2)-methyltransferase
MYIIAGNYRRQKLTAPKGCETRPTASRLRESLFNICQGFIDGARFLDLFAGSGAVGFEALSRGAAKAAFIDSSKEAIQCIRKNAAHLNVEAECQIMQGEIFHLLKWLDKQNLQFDIIYADPPYKTKETEGYSAKIIEFIDSSRLLAPEGVLFVEEDARHQPALSHLTTLELKDSRVMGHSALMQFRKASVAKTQDKV